MAEQKREALQVGEQYQQGLHTRWAWATQKEIRMPVGQEGKAQDFNFVFLVFPLHHPRTQVCFFVGVADKRPEF